MLSEKECVLLNHLRKNSRKSLTKMSRDTGIPISTLFDSLKKLEADKIIKHTCLLDFSKLGYGVKVSFIISANNKEEVKGFLLNHRSVNTLSALLNNNDFYAECIFKNFKEMLKFKENLDKFGVKSIQENFIIDEIKKEAFYL